MTEGLALVFSHPMRFPAVACTLALTLIVGCNRLKKFDDHSGAAPSAAAATAAAPAPAQPGARSIENVGEVPAWSPGGGKAKRCTTSAAAKAKLKPIDKGQDEALAAGSADLTALASSVGADTCMASARALATALNNGGFHRYQIKQYDAANRFWRAAIVVRPSFILARYNLACGLALVGKPEDAVAEIQELARAATDGDASASNSLEKAKSDADLASVRSDPLFAQALTASTGKLVGPRKEPEMAAQAVALLPKDFYSVKDDIGATENGVIKYKPAILGFWTWRPDSSTELLLASVIDDPAKIGQPKNDINLDYGALAVFQRSEGTLSLLKAWKTGESTAAVAAGKNGAVAFTYETMCGPISGVAVYKGGKSISVHETACEGFGSQ